MFANVVFANAGVCERTAVFMNRVQLPIIAPADLIWFMPRWLMAKFLAILRYMLNMFAINAYTKARRELSCTV